MAAQKRGACKTNPREHSSLRTFRGGSVGVVCTGVLAGTVLSCDAFRSHTQAEIPGAASTREFVEKNNRIRDGWEQLQAQELMLLEQSEATIRFAERFACSPIIGLSLRGRSIMAPLWVITVYPDNWVRVTKGRWLTPHFKLKGPSVQMAFLTSAETQEIASAASTLSSLIEKLDTHRARSGGVVEDTTYEHLWVSSGKRAQLKTSCSCCYHAVRLPR